MEPDKKKDIYFILYLLVVLIMAFIYFSVPERSSFFEYQRQWWGEMWDVIRGSTAAKG